jgi:hypothetical protein
MPVAIGTGASVRSHDESTLEVDPVPGPCQAELDHANGDDQAVQERRPQDVPSGTRPHSLAPIARRRMLAVTSLVLV